MSSPATRQQLSQPWLALHTHPQSAEFTFGYGNFSDYTADILRAIENTDSSDSETDLEDSEQR